MTAEGLSEFQIMSGGIKHQFLSTGCRQLPVHRNLVPALQALDTPAGGLAYRCVLLWREVWLSDKIFQISKMVLGVCLRKCLCSRCAIPAGYNEYFQHISRFKQHSFACIKVLEKLLCPRHPLNLANKNQDSWKTLASQLGDLE